MQIFENRFILEMKKPSIQILLIVVENLKKNVFSIETICQWLQGLNIMCACVCVYGIQSTVTCMINFSPNIHIYVS